jgi:uncharacterized iron-regulated membrane protein
MLYRDIHAVTGFWFSLLLLLVLAGGLPWTDVFGSNFKWFQDVTNTGYPKTWESSTLHSTVNGIPITLDDMVVKARALNLAGEVSIGLPQSEQSVFSVYNTTSDLSAMQMIHLDQYSGKQLATHSWSDIGLLMQVRLWVMAFHQGEFGLWNWYLMLFIAFMLLVMSCSAIISYVLRKQAGSWSVPKVPAQFKVGKGVVILIIILGVILPLFGVSMVLILVLDWLKGKRRIQLKRKQDPLSKTADMPVQTT